MFKKVVVHHLRDAEKKVGLDWGFFEDFEQVVGATRQLFGKPLHCVSLLFEFLVYKFADMYVVSYHKKDVELYFLPELRVSTPTNLTSYSTP